MRLAQNLVPDSTSILRILQPTNLDAQKEREAEAFANNSISSINFLDGASLGEDRTGVLHGGGIAFASANRTVARPHHDGEPIPQSGHHDESGQTTPRDNLNDLSLRRWHLQSQIANDEVGSNQTVTTATASLKWVQA